MNLKCPLKAQMDESSHLEMVVLTVLEGCEPVGDGGNGSLCWIVRLLILPHILCCPPPDCKSRVNYLCPANRDMEDSHTQGYLLVQRVTI